MIIRYVISTAAPVSYTTSLPEFTSPVSAVTTSAESKITNASDVFTAAAATSKSTIVDMPEVPSSVVPSVSSSDVSVIDAAAKLLPDTSISTASSVETEVTPDKSIVASALLPVTVKVATSSPLYVKDVTSTFPVKVKSVEV